MNANSAICRRIERAGETVFCYVDDPGPLLKGLAAHRELDYLQRRASLEDVFLKLTGRDLRD